MKEEFTNVGVRSAISTRDMAAASLFALLTGVGANIRIPLPLMPLTLQTLFVFLAGMMIGSKRAALAMTLYMLMGLLGLPVFTTGGGFHNVFSPSFGFVIGFIPASWVIGRICEKSFRSHASDDRISLLKNILIPVLACACGYLTYNIFGMAWFYMIINFVMGKGMTLYQSLAAAFLPFVLPDGLKIAVAITISTILLKRFRRMP